MYVLAGIYALFWLGSTVVNPILPLRIVEAGASEVELGWIVSLLSLTGLVSRIPLAILTARVGVRQVIMFSLVSRLSALALYAFAPSSAWFYPARVLDGVSIAILVPVLISEVSRHSLAVSTGDTMGRFLTSYGLASVVGPLICGALLEYLTFQQVFLATLSFPSLALLSLIEVRRHSLIDRSIERISGQRNEEPLHALKRIVRLQNLSILVFTRIIFSIGIGFITTFFPVYIVNDLGLSPSTAALAFAALGLANVLSRIPAGRLCDRIGERKPVMLVFATLAAAFFLMAKSQRPFQLVLIMALIGLGWGIYAVANWTVLSYSVDEKNRKLAAAYTSTAFDAGTAIGAVSSGFLAYAFSTSDVFLVGSVSMLAVLVAVLLFRNWPVSISASQHRFARHYRSSS